MNVYPTSLDQGRLAALKLLPCSLTDMVNCKRWPLVKVSLHVLSSGSHDNVHSPLAYTTVSLWRGTFKALSLNFIYSRKILPQLVNVALSFALRRNFWDSFKTVANAHGFLLKILQIVKLFLKRQIRNPDLIHWTFITSIHVSRIKGLFQCFISSGMNGRDRKTLIFKL